MGNTSNKSETDRKDSSTKHARGSKKVHSKKDDSTEDGFVPNEKKENK